MTAAPVDDTPPRVRVVPFGELSTAELAAWDGIQSSHPHVASACFRPEFAGCVDAVRGGVRVAVLETDAGPVGFFPHERDGGRGTPVGGRLCDFHGVIAGPDVRWDAEDLLAACGLHSYAFHMLPAAGQASFVPFGRVEREGVFIDLTGGFDAYIDRRTAEGSKRHRKVEQCRRRMARESGAVTFEWHTDAAEAWDRLLEWKRGQYAATGFTDVLAFDWVRGLLERCRDARGGKFAGVLSTLSAGGELAAVHFGLLSGTRMHSWFPAYAPDASRHGPGTILLMEVCRAAADRGVTAIDLGAGDQGYKWSFSAQCFPIHEGVAEPPGPRRAAARAGRKAVRFLKEHPVGAPARAAAKLVRPLRERRSLR